jgi:hypothetical protein
MSHSAKGDLSLTALCPACSANNFPGHTLVSRGPLETAVFAAALLILVRVLFHAAKYLCRPGELAPDHIKRTVLDDSAATLDRIAR